jgi:hypothetical protein
MMRCEKGHVIRLPEITVGKLPVIVCWACVAGKK